MRAIVTALIAAFFFMRSGLVTSEEQQQLRVVTYGTSLTAKGGWQSALSFALGKCFLRSVKVINLGRSGASSEWGVANINLVLRENPDILLLEFSTNDAALNRLISPARSRNNVRAIVKAVRSHNPATRIILMAMSPAIGWRGWVRPLLNHYYDQYEVLSTELGVEYIDHRPVWKTLPDRQLKDSMVSDGHPSSEVVVKLIVPKITAVIARNGCARKDSVR